MLTKKLRLTRSPFFIIMEESWGRLTDEERTDYDSLVTKEAKREFWQLFFLRDFRAFIKLLGYMDTGKFHEEQIEELSKVRFIDKETITRKLWLWSRGFFKTTIITQAHSLWLILNNPDIRILLVSYTLDVAKKMMREIKSPFVDNDDFRFFFREFCPQTNTVGKIEFGTSEEFTVLNRVKKFLKEPTMMCAGVGTNLTGLHFDYMKIDDLVTRDAVTNDTQIQASKDYYSSLRQLFDNPTKPREDIAGTIYHFNDLHREMMKNEEFTKSLIPVHDKHEVYAFPERISKEGFRSIREDPNMSPYDVSSQYLLTPHNPADAVFKEEWWQEYVSIPKGGAQYILVDPASTQKKRSDYSVLERWDVDYDGKHRLVEGIRDKLTAFQRIDVLFAMVKRSQNLKWVKYEVLGGRHGDLEVIDQRKHKEHLNFEVKETKGSNASKQDRVEQRLAGPWHSGIIYLPKNCFFKSIHDGKTYDFTQLYKLEFLQFPFCEHDDIIDCHSQMFEERLYIGKKIEDDNKPKSMTYGQYAAIKDNRLAFERNNPWGVFARQGY